VTRYPTKLVYQSQLNTQLHLAFPTNIIEYQNSPQPLRVVTPNARSAAPLREPSVERNISPRDLSADVLGMGSSNCVQSITLMQMGCNIIHPETGKVMEYMDILKEPTLKPLWKGGMDNECGRLFQGL
jgi:hypothetical protein